MTAISIILDIVLILVSLVLITAVLMQQGQKQGLGAIGGGAETFMGKNKARGIDAKLAKITKIGTVVFIVLAFAATIVTSTAKNAPVAAPAAEEAVVETAAEETATEAAEEATTEEAAEATEEAPAEEAAETAEEAPAEEAETEASAQ